MDDDINIKIYLQKVQKFFEKAHENDVDYFYTESDRDLFISEIRKVAIKNMEINGSPELTREQMEAVRVEVKYKPIRRESIVQYDIIGILYLN